MNEREQPPRSKLSGMTECNLETANRILYYSVIYFLGLMVQTKFDKYGFCKSKWRRAVDLGILEEDDKNERNM